MPDKIVASLIGLTIACLITACSQNPVNTDSEASGEIPGNTPAKKVAVPAEPVAEKRSSDSISAAQARPKESHSGQKGQSGATDRPILINYFGGIDAANIGFLVKTILAETANGETHFRINMNSTGGDPSYSISAYNLLKPLPITITTYNVNQVESAAVHLYCLGSHRYAHPRSIFTIHSVKWSLSSYSPAKLAAVSKKINLQQENVLNMLNSCMRVDKARIERSVFGDDDWYIDAKEAVRSGLVDQITTDALLPKKIYLISDGYKG